MVAIHADDIMSPIARAGPGGPRGRFGTVTNVVGTEGDHCHHDQKLDDQSPRDSLPTI